MTGRAEDALQDLARRFRMPTLGMDDLRRLSPAFDAVPFGECARRGLAALAGEDGGLLLATDDPASAEQSAWAAENVTRPFAWRLVRRADLAAYLASHEQALQALEQASGTAQASAPPEAPQEDLSLRSLGAEPSDVVRLVRATLREALKAGASDIHLETGAAGLAVKLRIDGLLQPLSSLPDRGLAAQVIARIKVLAELDVTEHRVPQDGRFRAADGERPVDFRVSIMPSIHGEDAVLRVLDKQALACGAGARPALDGLGFEPAHVAALRRLAAQAHGMLLVTGPTGSGKTTTLYAAISEINRGREKIVTIEDPVEYHIPGVLQIPVNEKKGLSFARGLRSILRHDPDRIMVGEIRDAETAAIAVQAALTGHLVFTTVHANNAFDVIGRFMHMSVDLYGFVSALNAVLAQRLIRLSCAACAAAGCGRCRGTGFRGRKAIAELVVLNDELRELIAARAPASQLREAARRNGTRLLREAALEAAARGVTTPEEADRVTLA